ncbi:M91 family zinc metallopeptidase [Pseudomonas asplenii]|uniref:M91 family zinc metallopeptidase n=1 Tax=Pseudomonas asplenii TaxID=53407 RepID=UPI002360B66A|nr:M91 family zinc metallopeptidase [Pseudomonas asplenii]
MNDLSSLNPTPAVAPEHEYRIDGNTETDTPTITPLRQYPDDERSLQVHSVHQDTNVLIERHRLQAPPSYRGPTDHLVFTSGNDDDRIHLYQTDHLVIDINERRYHLDLASDTQVIVLRTQAGDDRIRVDDAVKTTVFIDSAEGNDLVVAGGGFTKVNTGSGNDRIFTRSGASYVEAGAGDDLVRALGSGAITAYGGQGRDTLIGGKGSCFLDGGQGDDLLQGGTGHSVLSGSDGDDHLVSGAARTTAYTGTGTDIVDDLRPDVRLFNAYSAAETAPSSRLEDPGVIIAAKDLDSCGVVVEGSAQFQERVNDDLRLLLGSENGRQLLDALGQARERSGIPVVVRELSEEENGMCVPNHPGQDYPFIENGQAAPPSDGCQVYYDPSFLKGEVTSIVHLYHELCHAYNYVTGTMFPGMSADGIDGDRPRHAIPNLELQAVGLNIQGASFPFAGHPDPLSSNPEAFSENGLRREFGIPPRKQYRED